MALGQTKAVTATEVRAEIENLVRLNLLHSGRLVGSTSSGKTFFWQMKENNVIEAFLADENGQQDFNFELKVGWQS